MPRDAILGVKNGRKLVESLNTFLASLVERKLSEALLVPLELPSKNMLALALVSDLKMLKDSNPLAPIMSVSTAKIASTN